MSKTKKDYVRVDIPKYIINTLKEDCVLESQAWDLQAKSNALLELAKILSRDK